MADNKSGISIWDVPSSPGAPRTTPQPAVSKNAQGYADLASTLGSFSQGEKADRALRGDWTQNYDRLMMDSEEAKRQAESDALRKLITTSYLQSGGAPYKPASLNIGGRQEILPSFGFGPKAPSAAQQAGAGMLQGQLLNRLAPGGTYTPTDIDEYGKPGAMERIGSYGGSIAGGLGALDTITGGRGIGGFLDRIGLRGGDSNSVSQLTNALGLTDAQNAAGINSLGWTVGESGGMPIANAGSRIGSFLGQAAPYAGIGAGALGLMKDRGWAGNMASGASTGAGIGSLVAPGVGTAIGAGIGALGGLLRGIGGGPSDEEKEGREVAGQLRNSLASMASQGQKAEAGGDEASLLHIIVRDRALAKGLGTEQAENMASQAVRQLWESEKGGRQAVSQTGSRILSSLG